MIAIVLKINLALTIEDDRAIFRLFTTSRHCALLFTKALGKYEVRPLRWAFILAKFVFKMAIAVSTVHFAITVGA